jgi:bifunctional enzyme Fae/Hps
MSLDRRQRYLQIAFNYDVALVKQVLPTLRLSPRILIEAGTPYLKREGMNGIRQIRALWKGLIIADMKVSDGAVGEVEMVAAAGANGITVLGGSPTETLNLFVVACRRRNLISIIDMLGVDDPLAVLRHLRAPPDVVVLHRGRDEESTRGKVIQYKHVTRIRSKYDVIIAAAGGVDLREARSAIFNGANLIVANLVRPEDGWQGIPTNSDVAAIARQFLETIE